MSQRLDVKIVRADNSVAILTNQDSANPALWTRIKNAGQTAKHINIDRHATPAPPPPPPPVVGFGNAGQFAGRGIMLGGNADSWDQALALARADSLEAVAVVPTTPASWRKLFTDEGVRVCDWFPPEPTDPRSHVIEQAEGQDEWNRALTREPAAIVLNSWKYGQFPAGCVALVEAYYNEGWGVNFEVFKNYMPQHADGVVPLCGGYSAPGRSDDESAAIYQHLATWTGGPFPGFWMYAGEDLLTPQSVAVLKAWRP